MNIINELFNIYNKNNNIEILDLINKLKAEELKKINIKTNGKDRVNAINNIIKFNEKNRPSLNGYHPFNNQYVFTDSRILVCLNDNVGVKIAEMPIQEDTICKILDIYDIEVNKDKYMQFNLDIQQVLLDIKLKNEHITINDYCFNAKYVRDLYNILGENTKFYIKKHDSTMTVILGINSENELGVVIKK